MNERRIVSIQHVIYKESTIIIKPLIMSDKTDILNFKFIRAWIQRILPNSQALALAIILIAGFLLIYMLSNLLMPLFASIVLAYLLEGIILVISYISKH